LKKAAALQKLELQARKAHAASEEAKEQLKLAKSQLKAARKAARLSKKASKQARKRVEAARTPADAKPVTAASAPKSKGKSRVRDKRKTAPKVAEKTRSPAAVARMVVKRFNSAKSSARDAPVPQQAAPGSDPGPPSGP
jgi:hypothetical protein